MITASKKERDPICIEPANGDDDDTCAIQELYWLIFMQVAVQHTKKKEKEKIESL